MIENNLNCLTDCRAACCRWIDLPLSPQEYSLLRDEAIQQGEDPNELIVPSLPYMYDNGADLEGKKLYRLRGKCPALSDDNRCKFHGTPLQPEICQEMKAGSDYCLYRRNKKLVEIILYEETGNPWAYMDYKLRNRANEIANEYGVDDPWGNRPLSNLEGENIIEINYE